MIDYRKLTAAAALALGAAAFGSSAASARIICNADGDCWHTHASFVIAPGLALTEHPDDWKFADDHHHRWREHEGHGYWAHNEWRKM